MELGLAAIVVLIVVALVALTVREANRGERIQELLSQNEEQDTQLLFAHIWLKRALAGDSSVDVQREVVVRVDSAQLFCQGALGTGDGGTRGVEQVRQEPARSRIARMCGYVDALERLTVARLNQTSAANGGTALADRHDGVLREYLMSSAIVSRVVERMVRSNRRTTGRLFAVTVALLPLLAGLIVMVSGVSRRAIQADQEELRRLAAIIDSTDDAVITRSLDGIILSWNPGAERMLGYTAEEMIGTPVRDLIPPEYAHLEEEVIARIRRGEGVRSYGTVRSTRDGRLIDISLSVSPIFDTQGRVIAGASISRDVTQDKRTADELATSRAELDALIRAMTDVILVLDRDGRYVSIPGTAAPLLYRPSQELVGRTMHEVLPRELADRFLDDIRRALASRETIQMEYRLPIEERVVWFAGVISPMTDDQVVWVARDVTERKVVEEESREREQLLAEAQRLARVGSWTWNPATNRVTWSDQLFRMNGYDPQSFEPDFGAFLRTVHPEDRARVGEVVGRAAQELVPFDFDYRTVRPDGTLLFVHGRGAPVFGPEGELIRFQGTGQDITEQKAAEEELVRAKEAAEAANRAKSDFLSGMSHELRTPLNSVIGFANVLRKNKTETLRPQELSYLDRILANGKHLLGLINDILDLSKIEAGKMELQIEAVALEALVRATVDELQGSMGGKPVALEMRLPENLAPIDTDAGRMKQVLINLVGNAIKFTDRGQVKVVVHSDAESGNPTRIDVIDSGIGIPSERLSSIFAPFEQADQGTSRRYGGTGLGLAISRSLVELLGYRLEVRSVPGAGSTFSIILTPEGGAVQHVPLATSSGAVGAGGPMTHGRPDDFTGKLVLVIDDETDSRILLTEQIEEFGCRVIAASSGEQGLRIARELRPDLITIDLMMPGMDGWETIRLLKRDPELAGIPMVVVSIVAGEKRARVLGAVDLLEKPVDPDTLLAMLRRHLGGVHHVLVVDDEQDSRLLLATFLEAEDVEVTLAESGEQALGMIETFRPDLIILDLVMPGMDGLEFLRTLRSRSAFRTLPVVIVTAKDLSREEVGAVGADVMALIHKNAELDGEITRLVQRLWSPTNDREDDAE